MTECSFRRRLPADIVVESKAIVERFANARMEPFPAYLKLAGMSLGYLPNLGGDMRKRGNARAVDGLPEQKALGDLGDLAREDSDPNQCTRETAYAALQPLAMAALGAIEIEIGIAIGIDASWRWEAKKVTFAICRSAVSQVLRIGNSATFERTRGFGVDNGFDFDPDPDSDFDWDRQGSQSQPSAPGEDFQRA